MTLKRPIYPMSPQIKQCLEQRNLMAADHARPPYQRNDYIGWIERAKTNKTRLKRVDQMLAELELGHTYMKMGWTPKIK